MFADGRTQIRRTPYDGGLPWIKVQDVVRGCSARLRRILKAIPPTWTREDSLELSAFSSAHGTRNGERP